MKINDALLQASTQAQARIDIPVQEKYAVAPVNTGARTVNEAGRGVVGGVHGLGEFSVGRPGVWRLMILAEESR
eukprot:13386149-Heterocapsa_arctica.AAC.1